MFNFKPRTMSENKENQNTLDNQENQNSENPAHIGTWDLKILLAPKPKSPTPEGGINHPSDEPLICC
jgi:hypothetical protein